MEDAAATHMVAMAMSLSDRLSLAGLGTTGSSISNLDILDMVPFWTMKHKATEQKLYLKL